MLPHNATFNSTITPLITPTTPSSMALTITIFLLVFFFLGFFSIFARRHFFSTTTTSPVHHLRPPPPLLISTTHRYLTPHDITAGLDQATLRALPLLAYTPKDFLLGCVVCLGEFEEGERVKVIPACGHVFHPQCIDGWLVLHGSCPICRCSAAGEVWVDVAAIAADEETTTTTTTTTSTTGNSDDSDEDEGRESRLLAGLGRSKSFDRSMGGGTLPLRRTFSI